MNHKKYEVGDRCFLCGNQSNMNQPKYQIGDRVFGWQITRVYSHSSLAIWFYDLVNQNNHLSCDEATLARIFSQ